MNETINVKELRATLPKIVESVQRGERFTVLYRSRAAFRIVPVEADGLGDTSGGLPEAAGQGGESLDMAQLSTVGDIQTVQLPREFSIPGERARVIRSGRRLILEPDSASWDELFQSLKAFPDDFMREGRQQPDMQERDDF